MEMPPKGLQLPKQLPESALQDRALPDAKPAQPYFGELRVYSMRA